MESQIQQKRSRGFMGILKQIGPGIVAALALFAAGDISLMTLMGAKWGYSGLWLAVLAVGTLFAFFTVTSKYHLSTKESIVWAMVRPAHGHWIRYFTWFGVLLAPFLYNTYIIKGMGESWNYLVPPISAKIWSIVWILIGLWMFRKNIYNTMEWTFKIILSVLSLTVLYLFITVKPSFVGLLGSLIPRFLEGGSASDTFSLGLSIMGATTTSIIILGYCYMISEKGWTEMQHKRSMWWDSFISCALTLVFNAMLFAVAVETLYGKGLEVKTVHDLAKVLGMNLGTFGYYMFYIGLFAAVYSSWIGMTYMGALVAQESMVSNFGKKADESNARFRIPLLFVLIVPAIFTFTNVGFVTLVRFASAILTFLFLVPLFLILLLSNCKKFAPNPEKFKEYRAVWWENAFLGVTFIVIVYMCYKLVISWF